MWRASARQKSTLQSENSPRENKTQYVVYRAIPTCRKPFEKIEGSCKIETLESSQMDSRSKMTDITSTVSDKSASVLFCALAPLKGGRRLSSITGHTGFETVCDGYLHDRYLHMCPGHHHHRSANH